MRKSCHKRVGVCCRREARQQRPFSAQPQRSLAPGPAPHVLERPSSARLARKDMATLISEHDGGEGVGLG